MRYLYLTCGIVDVCMSTIRGCLRQNMPKRNYSILHHISFAMSCRAKLSQIIIYLGEYDTKDLDKAEILPKETLGVIERKIHPQFKYMLTQPDR